MNLPLRSTHARWLALASVIVIAVTASEFRTAGTVSPAGLPLAVTPSAYVYLPLVERDEYQPTFPIRAAFYYPWFPETWGNLSNPDTRYHPSLGYYSSTNPAVISQHVAAMQYGGIAAGIASWWGQGHETDIHFATILTATAGSTFRWSIYYEPEGVGDPTVSQITGDLTYLRDNYGTRPNFLRINSRFVVFVYNVGDGCSMVDRWKQANTVEAYIVLKVFSGYQNCANQPDGWHQYGPASAESSQGSYSFSISPGFWKYNEASPRLGRDLTRWRQNIRDMIASGARFQLITTFNEWGEGTAVESAAEWASPSGYGAYVDALHNNGLSSLSATSAGHAAEPALAYVSPLTPTSLYLPVVTNRTSSIPNFSHVFVIVMENHEYSSIIGSVSAPYLNSLANQYGLATNYFGIRHPSLPNYIALTGGDTFGITNDCTSCFVNATNIVDELEGADRSWKAYMESMPSSCFVGSSG